MARPPSIPRALDQVALVADEIEDSPDRADRHAATQAANRIMVALKASGDVSVETMDIAGTLCNRIRGAVKYVGDHPDRAAEAAGDMRHMVNKLRELLNEPRPSSSPNE